MITEVITVNEIRLSRNSSQSKPNLVRYRTLTPVSWMERVVSAVLPPPHRLAPPQVHKSLTQLRVESLCGAASAAAH